MQYGSKLQSIQKLQKEKYDANGKSLVHWILNVFLQL